ncbi:MAG: hypothetical protein ACYTFW_20820 [Planctomycetota bacterium]|jgi:hypothetical protein
MADIICPNCKEPWEWWFLKEDLIWETKLDEHVCENWDGTLTDEIRAIFKELGWEFGENISHIIRCEACPQGKTKVTLRSELAAAMSDLLGDDIDGFISEMEDAEYMFGDQLDL